MTLRYILFVALALAAIVMAFIHDHKNKVKTLHQTFDASNADVTVSDSFYTFKDETSRLTVNLKDKHQNVTVIDYFNGRRIERNAFNKLVYVGTRPVQFVEEELKPSQYIVTLKSRTLFTKGEVVIETHYEELPNEQMVTEL